MDEGAEQLPQLARRLLVSRRRAWICLPDLQRSRLQDELPLAPLRELLRPQASTCSSDHQGKPLEPLSRLLSPHSLRPPLSPASTSSTVLRPLRLLQHLLPSPPPHHPELQHLRPPRLLAPHRLGILDVRLLMVIRPRRFDAPRTSSSSFVKTTKQDRRRSNTPILKSVAGTRPSSSGPR